MNLNYEDARVWWMPQVPMTPFYVAVNSTEEAKKILDTLAYYDLFQLEHHIKPDYSNTGGLEVQVNGKWVEWEDDVGNCIDEIEEEENVTKTS